jgi:hypothetical protein
MCPDVHNFGVIIYQITLYSYIIDIHFKDKILNKKILNRKILMNINKIILQHNLVDNNTKIMSIKAHGE